MDGSKDLTRDVRIGFVSLGCAKNLVDSEKMLGQLAEGGCVVGADLPDADVIVVNTCGFLEASRSEAHEVIREAVELKKTGRCRRVVVAGCLVQRDGTALQEAVPGIDALVGVHQRGDLLSAVRGGAGGSDVASGRRSAPRREADLFLGEYHPQSWTDQGRLRLTPKCYAYLRISEGCDQKCTFCTIPSIRGPMHCKRPEQIISEARELIADGAVELNLIGQDTTSYGRDIGYAAGLAGLLRELNRVDGVRWLRLLYAYPSVFSDEMIDAIAECERVVKYVDIPLQHISDRMLRAMYRRVTREQTETLLEKLRERIPGLAIRTTLIAGFPGETEADFNELTEFVRQSRFEALGVFAYSLEPDTPAGRMQDQLSDAVQRERVDVLMQTQQEVAFATNRGRIGSRFDVLVERDEADEDGTLRGRAAFQAPQVDGTVRIRKGCELRAGEFVSVRCVSWQDYDLIVRPTSVMEPIVETQ